MAAEGMHFAAQGLCMAPMRQIRSICCTWPGQAGHAQVMVVGRSGPSNLQPGDGGSRLKSTIMQAQG